MGGTRGKGEGRERDIFWREVSEGNTEGKNKMEGITLKDRV